MEARKEASRDGTPGRRAEGRGEAPSRSPVRVAVDIGGTFTDLVLVHGSRLAGSEKLLTTPDDPSVAVAAGIEALLGGVDPASVGEVVHGTTLVANALIERRGAVTALVTTRGFRDVVSIGREHRYDLYDLFLEMPEPLVPRRLRYEVTERVLADGSVDSPLDPGEATAVARRAVRQGVEAVAVCLIHGYRNPGHERALAAVFEREAPGVAVSLSSDVSPELGEFGRASTTVANAFVLPLVDRYLARIEERLRDAGLRSPLRIMLSTGAGGLAGTATARRYPVRLLESGPAAGALSAAFWAGGAGHADVLAFDMGGTTAKACLVEDGVPLVAREMEAAREYRFARGSGLPLRVPVVDLIEIGAGGGSVARVGPFGLPKVGPDSAGADPGPACYGRGGREPTVTDADLVLGYLDPGFFLGGRMRLDPPAAGRALDGLARALRTGVEEAAAAVHRVVDENMASAARMHAVERGRDLRRFCLVATGGAGPVHAWGVARSLGIRTVLFPAGAGVASAFGMLTANPGLEFARSLPSLLPQTAWPEVRRMLASMTREGIRRLRETGVVASEASVEVAADVRHRGQGDAVTVGLGNGLGRAPGPRVEEAFEEAYVRLYGRRPPGVDAEITTWRVRVSGPRPALEVTAPAGGPRRRKGTRRAWFAEAGGFVEAAVYDRYRLGPGAVVRGPALVEERESTVVIGPGGRALVDAVGNLEVSLP